MLTILNKKKRIKVFCEKMKGNLKKKAKVSKIKIYFFSNIIEKKRTKKPSNSWFTAV